MKNKIKFSIKEFNEFNKTLLNVRKINKDIEIINKNDGFNYCPLCDRFAPCPIHDKLIK